LGLTVAEDVQLKPSDSRTMKLWTGKRMETLFQTDIETQIDDWEEGVATMSSNFEVKVDVLPGGNN